MTLPFSCFVYVCILMDSPPCPINFFNMLFCEASYSCVCPLSDLRKLKKSYIQLFAKKQTSLLNSESFVLSCLAYFICHAHPMLSFPSMSHILCLSRARVVSVNFKTWENIVKTVHSSMSKYINNKIVLLEI